MSKASRKFQVPDRLANLYDFANSLDLRHFSHHGVQHVQSDELTGPRQLAAWMACRGLLTANIRITPVMFETALRLRSAICAYLACSPAERAANLALMRSLDAAMRSFPLVVTAASRHGRGLLPYRDDALSGLSVVVAELHEGAVQGTLDRLKTCAAEECRRVFFDRSKPATRRWCMSALCGNRAKTRSYRERLGGPG